MSYLVGCDISQYQGDINWQELNPGTNFVIIKASGGDVGLYRDSKLTLNQAGARSISATTAVGYYHFAGGGDPVAEADYFIQQVGPLQLGEFLVLDWEIPNSNAVAWCQSFVNEVHAKTGIWTLLYCDAARLQAYDWTPVTANCGVWVADYGVVPENNVPIKYQYVMHQYKDNGTFPGIQGNVDTDAFFGTLDELKKYGLQMVVVEPVVVPDPLPEPVVGDGSTTVITPTASATEPTAPTDTTTPSPVITQEPTPTSSTSVVKAKATYTVGLAMLVISIDKYITGHTTLSQYLTTVQGTTGWLGLAVMALRLELANLGINL